mgnify:CR=1 FL=1
MADSTFKVTIITPDGTVYENKDATMLVMDTRGGQMGIMANHVPWLQRCRSVPCASSTTPLKTM